MRIVCWVPRIIGSFVKSPRAVSFAFLLVDGIDEGEPAQLGSHSRADQLGIERYIDR